MVDLDLMDGVGLHELQAPSKKQYREMTDTALITLKAQARLGEGIIREVDTNKKLIEAGFQSAKGDNGIAMCSGKMLLETLVACTGVTLASVAASIGIILRDATLRAEGDLDFRGTLGISKQVTVGFQHIRLYFDLDTDASNEQIATLIRLTQRYCVVLQTLCREPDITTTSTIKSSLVGLSAN